MGGLRDLLRVRDFRLPWVGQAMSNFGDALTSLALLITAQRLTGSTSAVGTFFNPAKTALLPRITGELLAANSVMEMSRVAFALLGTAVAGVVAGMTGGTLGVLFAADSATFLLSAMLEARLGVDGAPPTRSAAAPRIWSEVTHGLRTVLHSRVLTGVMVGAGVIMLGLGAVNVLLVPFIIEVLEVPETWFGAIEGAQVSSMILAAGLMAVLSARFRPTSIISVCLGGAGVVVASVALVTEAWHLMAALFAVGWFVTPLQASVSTLVQSEVGDELRGRTGSALSTVVGAGLLGVRGVFVAAGIVGVVAGGITAALFRGAAPLTIPTPAET